MEIGEGEEGESRNLGKWPFRQNVRVSLGDGGEVYG